LVKDYKKCKEDKKEILHTIKIFEGKFEEMCQMVFGIKIKVSKVEYGPGEGK
jgi:hypothetical protein